jgi:hypothetical protein
VKVNFLILTVKLLDGKFTSMESFLMAFTVPISPLTSLSDKLISSITLHDGFSPRFLGASILFMPKEFNTH